jgi:hypothetical protein
LAELGLSEVFKNLAIIESDPNELWKSMMGAYQKEQFYTLVYEEFSDLFVLKEMHHALKEIHKVKVETEKQIRGM